VTDTGDLRDPDDAAARTEGPDGVSEGGGDAREKASDDQPEPDPEEQEWRRRRRARLSYRAADRAMMSDGVLILMAMIVALFMVYTRGCQSSLDGLSKVLTGDAPPSQDGQAEKPR
jgi:hypothetical protein